MKSVHTRPAEIRDYDDIADVWHQGASLPGVGPAVTKDALRARLEVEIANGWSVTVLEFDQGIVGFLAVNTHAKLLAQLFVRPDHIGSGFGRHLLLLAKQQMPTGFSLSTAATNESARSFYEHSGLKLTGLGQHPRRTHEICYYAWPGPTE